MSYIASNDNRFYAALEASYAQAAAVAAQGRIPAVKLGRSLRFSRLELERYSAKRDIGHGAVNRAGRELVRPDQAKDLAASRRSDDDQEVWRHENILV